MSPKYVFINGYVVTVVDDDVERGYGDEVFSNQAAAEEVAQEARDQGWDAEVWMLIPPNSFTGANQ